METPKGTPENPAVDENPENRDPLSGAPGSHPIGTGIGTASGAAAGAAIGGAVGGPAGMLVGGAVGAVAGAATGHAVGESANPTVEGPASAELAAAEATDVPGRSSLLNLEQ
jgi:phage tail tape-measure protein